jgi:hypothetical protein
MTVEQDCLAVLAEELGPAAKPFLYRICRQQLSKEPSMLQKGDIDKLAKSCYFGVKQALGVPIADKVQKNLMELQQTA